MRSEKHWSQFHKGDVVTVTIEDIGTGGEGIGHVGPPGTDGIGIPSFTDGMGAPAGTDVTGPAAAAAGGGKTPGGYTLFIRDTVPGDVVRAMIIKVKKDYGYARLLEVTMPSQDRVPARCPVARPCGGCQLQELSYGRQLIFKERKVRGDLIRIGGFPEELIDSVLQPVIGMEEPWRYRNKAQFPVGERDGEAVAGFYAARTHSIIPVQDCLIGSPVNQKIMELILQYMRTSHVSAYREDTGKGLIRHVLIRTGFHSGEIMVCLVINGSRLPQEEALIHSLTGVPGMASICVSVNTQRTNVIMGQQIHTLWGKGSITDTLRLLECTTDGKDLAGQSHAGRKGPRTDGGAEDGRTEIAFAPGTRETAFSISPLSFYQVNPRQTEKLYSLIRFFAGLTGHEVVWDVYCGVGTISCFLAPDAQEVFGVEVIPDAVRDARENARRNGLTNTTFVAGRAEEVLPAYVSERGGQCPVDVVVVDPPRKGCDPACLQTILDVRPQRVIYVSCDSATLARDLKILTGGGYDLRVVQPVDQFAHSVHVETVCLLSNRKYQREPDAAGGNCQGSCPI